jgi:formylglycine-generating enzyme
MRCWRLFGFASLLTAGCAGDAASARDQWLVTVGTDLPVPQLADRLLVEVLDEAGASCTACRRQLDVGDPGKWPISFGIVPAPATDSLRLTLHRSVSVGLDGLPAGPTRIVGGGVLPSAQGLTKISVKLELACFGIVDESGERLCDPATRELSQPPTLAAGGEELPAPGSAELAALQPCDGAVPSDMTCVGGGLFLLGSPRPIVALEYSPSPERLVRISSFALDTDEVTVGSVRELVGRGELSSAPRARSLVPDDSAHACTYLGQNDATNDAFPINCISHALASEVCQRLGKRLPTEAEWEYAASNQTTETTWPWGGSGEPCDFAIIGRGRLPFVPEGESIDCIQGDVTEVPSGPVAGGHPADRSHSGIANLGGNVAEWTADDFQEYGTGCWVSDSIALVDPRCEVEGGPLAALRGGDWSAMPFSAEAARRYAAVRSYTSLVDVGFRCALSLD